MSGGLRTSLSLWQVVGLSVALMAPSMAVNINPQPTAAIVGRAVPLTFVIATVGVLCLAYVFARLCQHFHHAGSVYGFVGATLGARAGVVAGWTLLGTYLCYGVVTASAAGIFGTAFLQEIHAWPTPPAWAPFVVTAVALVGVGYLAIAPVRAGTRLLLGVEAVTVVLILIVTVAVVVRLLGAGGPAGQTVTWSVFTLPPKVAPSALFLGVVFGFLSFAGFEASATLGEEARTPRRNIPRAILGTAIFGGLYFTVVTAVEVMGFGATAAGVTAFTHSGSLLGDLGSQYLAGWVGDLITLGAAVSGFGCALACAVGAARLAFAGARDGLGPPALAEISPRRGTPATATTVAVGVMYLIVLIEAGFGATPLDAFTWSATIGTLILLIAYLAATLAAIRLLFFSRPRRVPAWQVIIPLGAIGLLGYTVYRNVVPYPSGPGAWLPIVGIAWIALGVLSVLVAPRAARRAGIRLTHDAGLQPIPATPAATAAPTAARPPGQRR
ncbi:MAG: APC family permease [Pseudonocardiaceae bacterium]